jgi:hypothetical protein
MEEEDLMKALCASLAQEETKDDRHDTFGKQVASMMRDVPPKKVFRLQAKITMMIAEAMPEEEEEGDK